MQHMLKRMALILCKREKYVKNLAKIAKYLLPLTKFIC